MRLSATTRWNEVVAYRLEKTNSLLRHELSEMLRQEIKDPRLSGLISITAVEVSHDLKLAKVYVSSLGGKAEKDTILTILKNATGFLRGELARTINMRYTPDLQFIWDDSIERGAHLIDIMDHVKLQDGV